MLSTTTFLLSKTFLLSQFSPPSAAHNIADTHLPLCDPTWLPFIKIFPPLCSPCFQLQHSFYQKHSFYHNFPPPLQPMLSTTTFLLSKTFLLSQFSPPSAAHNIADTHLPLCDLLSKFSPPSAAHAFNYNIPFIKNIPFITISPPLCSPQHSRHTFAFVRPYLTFFYQNFTPPLQPMLSTTTFLLSKTFLLSQFTSPSAAHAFNYNIPFIKNITFITIFPPLYSPQHSRHTFAFVRPYLTSFYQNFPPPLQPMLSTTTFLLSKTFLLSQFSPPSAAHNIADTHLPLCDPTWLPFIKIFSPLCNPCFQLQHSFYQKHSFYQNFPPPLQPTT